MAQRDLKWVITFLKLFFKARILLIDQIIDSLTTRANIDVDAVYFIL